jgi:single-strand DNA-binding protein
MLNRVILIGRVTRDPELRYTQLGNPVLNMTVAVDRPFTNQQGEREADFIDVVVWNKQAENCANYLNKGRLVAVEGRLQIRSYEDSQGNRRRVAEVVANNVRFLPDGKNGGGRKNAAEAAPPPDDDPFGDNAPFNEDDIPF